MSQILMLLATSMDFLWRAGFRITESQWSESFGNAHITVQSLTARFRFTNERGQLFLSLQPVATDRADEWFTIDLVRRMLSGEQHSSQVTESNVEFIREHLVEIDSAIAHSWETTRVELKSIARRRAKEMFS